MDLIPLLLAFGWIFAFFLLHKKWKTKTHKSPPEPAGAWPVIGHLLQLRSQNPKWRTLAALADKCGPVFLIRLGRSQVLVISNWKAVKDCFATNDRTFSSGLPSSFGAYITYNYASFGTAPYGPYWRQMRKIAQQELLSTPRLEKLRHVRVCEIETSIKELFYNIVKKNGCGKSPVKVEMSKWFEQLTLNMIMRTVLGRRYNDIDENGTNNDARFKEMIKKVLYFAGQSVVSDVFPILRWLDLLGCIKSMKRVSKQLDAIFQIWINEHNERRMKSEPGDEQDFIDSLLSIIKEESIFGHSRETVIKAAILNLMIGGFMSSSIHLTWMLCLLLNNPTVMRQAQEEIDAKVGKERWVEETDIKNLHYLQAIAKETLRLYPPTPLSLPRLAMQDCNVAGYVIPKGTALFVNVWKLHRDPRIWSEPDKFMPERFLSSQCGEVEIELSSQDFEFAFTPFGSGRRICPAINFATQVTQLTLARMLQGFDFRTPSNLPVDMAEDPGINLFKAVPLGVLAMPRLPNYALYG